MDVGTVVNLETQEQRTAPILRFLIEGKDGRLTVGSNWLEITHCPYCGEKIAHVDTPGQE